MSDPTDEIVAEVSKELALQAVHADSAVIRATVRVVARRLAAGDDRVDAIREEIRQFHVQVEVGASGRSWCTCGAGMSDPDHHDHERHILRVALAALAGGDR